MIDAETIYETKTWSVQVHRVIDGDDSMAEVALYCRFSDGEVDEDGDLEWQRVDRPDFYNLPARVKRAYEKSLAEFG